LDSDNEEDNKSEGESSIKSDCAHLLDYICALEPNKGYGLRAVRNLKKGMILGLMRGIKITNKTILKALLKTGIHKYIVQINNKLWINCINVNCNVRLVNHSCVHFNCELVWLTSKIVGLRLIRNVKRGEYFSFNYRLHYYVSDISKHTIKCNCTNDCKNWI
jgi:hypothetical protein